MGIGHILNQKRIGTQLIKRCTRTMTLQLLLKSYSSFFVQKPGLRYKPQSINTCNPVLLVGKHIVLYVIIGISCIMLYAVFNLNLIYTISVYENLYNI